jgi:acyl carrier protein
MMEVSSQENERAVLKIIAEELDVGMEAMQPSTSLIEDLNADSLALINIVMKIEERFKITVPEEHWRNLRTIGDINAYVQQVTNSHVITADDAQP